MKQLKTQFLAEAAMIAALYVVITVLLAPFGFKEVQVRVSEALTILPILQSKRKRELILSFLMEVSFINSF